MKKTLLLFLFCSLTFMDVLADKVVKACDPQVSYTGRTQALPDGSVRYDWIGTYWQTEFTGGKLAVVVSESGESYHNIFIDGKLIRKIHITGKTPHKVVLAEGLDKKTHCLRLQKCTEGEYGCTTIHSVQISNGGNLKAVAPKKRMIEVFGDSYTCGYGTEGHNALEHFILATENCNKAYGCIIARYFDADYSLVAHSGQGMVRDWGDSLQVSHKSMSTRFTQLFDAADTVSYSFSAYKPSLVIINLGTNDYSPGNIPNVEQYVGNYKKMIATVCGHYGNIPVVCITPHSANPYLQAAIKQLAKDVAELKNVHLAQPMPDIVTYERDLGSDWHPNYQGQTKIAMTLIPQISAIMGWNLPAMF